MLIRIIKINKLKINIMNTKTKFYTFIQNNSGGSFHISKAYVYFAMAFSLAVESINIYSRKKKDKKSMVKKEA